MTQRTPKPLKPKTPTKTATKRGTPKKKAGPKVSPLKISKAKRRAHVKRWADEVETDSIALIESVIGRAIEYAIEEDDTEETWNSRAAEYQAFAKLALEDTLRLVLPKISKEFLTLEQVKLYIRGLS